VEHQVLLGQAVPPVRTVKLTVHQVVLEHQVPQEIQAQVEYPVYLVEIVNRINF
jgi:hypothetical protein